MAAVVEKLSLSRSVSDALVSRSGGLGGYLSLVESYERGDWTAVSRISAELCIEEQAIPDLYIEACRSGSLLPI